MTFQIISRQINWQQQCVEQLVEFQGTLMDLVIQQGQTTSAFYGHFNQFITSLTPILQNQSVSLNSICDTIGNIILLQHQVNHTLGQVADTFKGFKDVFQQQQNTLTGVQKTIDSIDKFQDRIRRLNAQVQAQQSTIQQARQESKAWRNHLVKEQNDFALVNNYEEW
jgi:methyl-accepting chemotaxis protein